MPRGDGTGPMGAGSRTGRGFGYCADYSIPEYANTRYGSQGRQLGGFGRGRGFRRMYHATGQPGWVRFGYSQAVPARAPEQAPAKEQEISFLEHEQKEIESELEAIKKRIAEMREQ